MKKKAEETNPQQLVVYTIVLLVALFVILLFLSEARIKQANIQQIDQCRKSVDIQAQSKIKGVIINLDQQGNEGLQCPTIIEKITDKDEQLIMKKLADQMAYCWYKFGEGNKDLFAPLQDDERNYCAICSLISFKNSALKKEIPNFINFLDKSYIPVFLGRKTYSEYLTKVETSKDAENINTQSTSTINTDEKYAVILLYSKKGYEQRIWKAIENAKDAIGISSEAGIARKLIIKTATIKGTAGIAIIGTIASTAYGYATGSEKTADWSAGVILLPYDEDAIKDLGCEELPVK